MGIDSAAMSRCRSIVSWVAQIAPFALLVVLPAGALQTPSTQAPPPGATTQSDEAMLLVAQGARALQEGDLEAAQRSFTKALERSPELGPAILGSAEVYRQQGDLERALEGALRAEALAPGTIGPAVTVAGIQIEMGAPEEAYEKLERVIQVEPQHVLANLHLALALRDMGRLEDGIKVLEAAWERGLTDPILAEQLGYLLLSANRPLEAIEIAEISLEEDPTQPGSSLVLGLALAQSTDRRTEAERWLQQAIDLGTVGGGIAYLEIGKLQLDANRIDEALANLRSGEGLAPKSTAIQMTLSRALRASGDTTGAAAAERRLGALASAGEESPAGELSGGLIAAQSLALGSHYSEALRTIDDLLTRYPDEPRALELRAKVLLSMGRTREALVTTIKARELAPTAELHFLEGLLLSGMDRTLEAEAALRRAVALDPDLGQAHASLGGAVAKQNRPAEAVAYFQRALDLGADSPTLRLGYSAALESLGRDDEAEAQMEAYRNYHRP